MLKMLNLGSSHETSFLRPSLIDGKVFSIFNWLPYISSSGSALMFSEVSKFGRAKEATRLEPMRPCQTQAPN